MKNALRKHAYLLLPAIVLFVPCNLLGQDRSLDLGEAPVIVDFTQARIEVERNILEQATTWISIDRAATDPHITIEGSTEDFATSDLIISFKPCPTKSLRPTWCKPVIDKVGNNLARVQSPPEALLVTVTGKEGNATKTTLVRIELNYRPWQLQWSGGLIVTNGRDPRYVLKAATSGKQTATRVGSEEYQQAFVAAGHLLHARLPSIGFAFGVGSQNANLQSSVLLAGLTYVFRPHKLIDSVFVSAGSAYVPIRRLKPEYSAAESIPAGATIDDVTRTAREFHFMFGLTFRVNTGEQVIGPLTGSTSH